MGRPRLVVVLIDGSDRFMVGRPQPDKSREFLWAFGRDEKLGGVADETLALPATIPGVRTMIAFLVAGTASGVGKTTTSLALMAAFRQRGLAVQPFKCGPDFLDGSHHTAICGRASRNLDTWMLDLTVNQDIFDRACRGADAAIVEGMMGLFDGVTGCGEQGSSAEIAKRLDLPVVLVLDASKSARSIAAMVKGFEIFDPELPLRRRRPQWCRRRRSLSDTERGDCFHMYESYSWVAAAESRGRHCRAAPRAARRARGDGADEFRGEVEVLCFFRGSASRSGLAHAAELCDRAYSIE